MNGTATSIVLLSGSVAGTKTRTALRAMEASLRAMEASPEQTPGENEISFLDLADYSVRFSDGRNYLDYSGDTAHIVRTIMAAEIQLKLILTYLKAHIVEDYLFIEEKEIDREQIVDDDVHLRIERLIDGTLTLAEVYREVRKRKDEEYGF